ncbi:Fungal Zn(2)-Cys(6) binuclear cluster domain family protein [Candida parapsilosis]|uniref:Glucose starvation modulator protein 1 n=1 Tax=Candida parapsilosis TaxID=5480 RepID=A0A8X7NNY3_CANPA|nr:Fungal Zn(2)-Cys(6) binuclear cluster domain family protein [Candida parapsilosis]
MTKKLTPQEKQNRKPASRACTFCHQKHLQCSNERPCKNCVKRNIASECHDIVRKRVKYLTGSSKPSTSNKSRQSSEVSTQNSSFSTSPVSIMEDGSKTRPAPIANEVNDAQLIPIQLHSKQETSSSLPMEDSSVTQIKDIWTRLLSICCIKIQISTMTP